MLRKEFLLGGHSALPYLNSSSLALSPMYLRARSVLKEPSEIAESAVV